MLRSALSPSQIRERASAAFPESWRGDCRFLGRLRQFLCRFFAGSVLGLPSSLMSADCLLCLSFVATYQERAGKRAERIADAFRRIILNETGVSADISQSTFKGVFEHIYDSNFANRSDFGTHYVVLAYQITQPFDDVRLDSQHSAFEWWDDERIRTSRVVHENTRAYFLND